MRANIEQKATFNLSAAMILSQNWPIGPLSSGLANLDCKPRWSLNTHEKKMAPEPEDPGAIYIYVLTAAYW